VMRFWWGKESARSGQIPLCETATK
jgi:hypothetical protein